MLSLVRLSRANNPPDCPLGNGPSHFGTRDGAVGNEQMQSGRWEALLLLDRCVQTRKICDPRVGSKMSVDGFTLLA